MAILPKSVREEKLRELRADESKAVGKQKLFYKGKPRVYPTFEVNLDLLIYNAHNGRLETDMLTWKKEHSIEEDGVYNAELHSQIEKFLWNVNTQRNKQTLEDLQDKGQLRPAIVTLDGVIIDGNRRAMLLRRAKKQFIETVILPDAYAEDEIEIVKLETQYQMGEDAKLDYGPLEKYLHVKRLKGLDIEETEIAELMGISVGEVEKLKGIMELMDEYLDQIDCTGLYTMLRQKDGTKEGMFVDLYQDLKRFKGGSSLTWPVGPTDLDDLKTIQFDYIRFGGEFSDTGKTYRAISHDGAGKKSFFAHLDIWKPFSDAHHKEIDPTTEALYSLDAYVGSHPECETRVDAAEARDREWKDKVGSTLKRIFGQREDDLTTKVEIIEPGRLLSLAMNALEKIDIGSDAFTSDPANAEMVNRINNLTYEMRKRFKKRT